MILKHLYQNVQSSTLFELSVMAVWTASYGLQIGLHTKQYQKRFSMNSEGMNTEEILTVLEQVKKVKK